MIVIVPAATLVWFTLTAPTHLHNEKELGLKFGDRITYIHQPVSGDAVNRMQSVLAPGNTSFLNEAKDVRMIDNG